MRRLTVLLGLCLLCFQLAGQTVLDSRKGHDGQYDWKMCRAGDVRSTAKQVSTPGFDDDSWQQAVVPGTVLTSLVANGVYPDPYYGIVNKLSEGLIPDLADAGREFYTYWFRTEFNGVDAGTGKRVFLQPMGINYRAEFWLNGTMVGAMAGMFNDAMMDVTDFIIRDGRNALAVLVCPVDEPGRWMQKSWGAPGENHNGGDGKIGWNTTQLMTVGWDFTFDDGVRDRNAGIWKSIRLFSKGDVGLSSPFVVSTLSHPDYDSAAETVSVEVVNNVNDRGYNVDCLVQGEIEGTGIRFEKTVSLVRGERRTVTFTAGEFPQLLIRSPKLWWPKNKGEQNLYKLKLQVSVGGEVSDAVETSFGIREVTVTTDTPDKSKVFIVNGKRIFIRGSNWIPEAMQRTDDARMRTELAYTAQSGINMLRLWGGGIAESDLFYTLCDEYGILVWQEFWMTGDTRHPRDEAVYFNNMESTVKRIRNHPSLAFYVSSNESTEMSGAEQLLARLDGTRPYQMQSECDGIHDGSPYKQVNPMCHYTNTASERGSRIDGFNPEYGAPTLPVIENLRRMMPADKLWPIDKATWDYLDGNGFHLMSSLYADLVNEYGESQDIESFAFKGQLLGAMNSKSIWETWNYNRLDDGDRFCSGLLFWYHNSPNVQVCARMWDWYLEPTASLYHTMHSLEPLHVQFDYLKNTVSVVNDGSKAIDGLTVTARLYDLDSRLVRSWSTKVDAAADRAVTDVLKLEFPAGISDVHFISLELSDTKGNILSENFYWRSKDEFKGRESVSGPCSSGFGPLEKMKRAALSVKTQKQADGSIKVVLKNTTGRIAFFNRLQLRDSEGEPMSGTLYSDNFFTILPHKSVTVTLTPDRGGASSLLVEGWNTPRAELRIR
ncbi:MAG: glycoside hydrolase family 2 [Bacteroidales bacterium]|nr:glycoside hydrolase family 2 [Bacteroidales bacterium]